VDKDKSSSPEKLQEYMDNLLKEKIKEIEEEAEESLKIKKP
jgi:hypothetical protein